MKNTKIFLICLIGILVPHAIILAQNQYQKKYNLDLDNFNSEKQIMPEGWLKGGGFLSVSVNKFKDKWLTALEKEKMSWENVLEQKEFLSEILKEYEITSIPQTFLIDENGKIIVNNPNTDGLEDYLKKNLK